MDIDFTNLPLQSVIATLLFFAVIDTACAYLVAVVNKNFNFEYALDFLTSHIAKVAVPIALMAIVGHGIPAVGIPAIPAAGIAAAASLAVYALTTIASIKGSFDDKAVVPE